MGQSSCYYYCGSYDKAARFDDQAGGEGGFGGCAAGEGGRGEQPARKAAKVERDDARNDGGRRAQETAAKAPVRENKVV